MKRIVACLAIALAVMYGYRSYINSGSLRPTIITEELASNTQLINKFVDETIILQLRETPSTGYTWTFEPWDETVLKKVSDDLEKARNKDDKDLTRTIVFEPLKPGLIKVVAKKYDPVVGLKERTFNFNITEIKNRIP